VLLESNFILVVTIWIVDDLLCDQHWLAFSLENTHDLELEAGQKRFGSRWHERRLFTFEVQDEGLLLSLQN
jgi:hypothetical protein